MKLLKNLFRDVGRFKVHKKSGYKIDRDLVKLMTILVLSYLVFSFFWGLAHERYYVTCPGPSYCQNPFYGLECNKYGVPLDVCDMETLYPGFERGYKAPFLIHDAPIFAFFLIGLFSLINHFSYNNKGGGY